MDTPAHKRFNLADYNDLQTSADWMRLRADILGVMDAWRAYSTANMSSPHEETAIAWSLASFLQIVTLPPVWPVVRMWVPELRTEYGWKSECRIINAMLSSDPIQALIKPKISPLELEEQWGWNRARAYIEALAYGRAGESNATDTQKAEAQAAIQAYQSIGAGNEEPNSALQASGSMISTPQKPFPDAPLPYRDQNDADESNESYVWDNVHWDFAMRRQYKDYKKSVEYLDPTPTDEQNWRDASQATSMKVNRLAHMAIEADTEELLLDKLDDTLRYHAESFQEFTGEVIDSVTGGKNAVMAIVNASKNPKLALYSILMWRELNRYPRSE